MRELWAYDCRLILMKLPAALLTAGTDGWMRIEDRQLARYWCIIYKKKLDIDVDRNTGQVMSTMLDHSWTRCMLCQDMSNWLLAPSSFVLCCLLGVFMMITRLVFYCWAAHPYDGYMQTTIVQPIEMCTHIYTLSGVPVQCIYTNWYYGPYIALYMEFIKIWYLLCNYAS